MQSCATSNHLPTSLTRTHLGMQRTLSATTNPTLKNRLLAGMKGNTRNNNPTNTSLLSRLCGKRERGEHSHSKQTNQTKKFQVKKLQTSRVKSLFIWQKTYYSITDQIHLRTDYLFINTEDRHRIKGRKIGRADVSDHNPLYLSEEVEKKNVSVRLSYYEMGPKVNKLLPRQTQYTQYKTHETYHLLKISSIVSMSVIHKFKLEEKKDFLRTC